MSLTKPTIRIDVVSDVVCPWCYIGKRRLEKAIDQLKDEFNFEVEYHPFELNPQMPLSGLNQKEYLTDKFGSEDRYDQLTGQVSRVAAQEGLTFDYDKQQKSPNTRMLHSVVQLAKLENKHKEAIEAFFKAYFTDGADLTVKENIVEIAREIGLKNAADENLFSDENALLQVALTEQEMSRLGITGVPFYIINNKYGVSGAQAPETFASAFRQAAKEITVLADGESCDVDKKNC